jgi:acyl dehydratase
VHGRWYEDFAVGDHYQHPFGRTISEADNTWFTLLTMNTNQAHFNAHFAASTPFHRVIVNSGLTIAIVLGLSVGDLSQNAMANLGLDDVRLPHPVFVGDTLYAESLVTGARESRSRPYAGIVTCRTRGLNQDGDECITWTRAFMVYKRDAPQASGHFPEARSGPMTEPTNGTTAGPITGPKTASATDPGRG